jgi:flavorubredoxin
MWEHLKMDYVKVLVVYFMENKDKEIKRWREELMLEDGKAINSYLIFEIYFDIYKVILI